MDIQNYTMYIPVYHIVALCEECFFSYILWEATHTLWEATEGRSGVMDEWTVKSVIMCK